MSDHDRDDDHAAAGGLDEATEAMLGAYVLDAVDADERRRVEELLGRDAAARDEVARLRTVVDQLAEAAAGDATAPAGLWGSIADRLGEHGEHSDLEVPGELGTADEPGAGRSEQGRPVPAGPDVVSSSTGAAPDAETSAAGGRTRPGGERGPAAVADLGSRRRARSHRAAWVASAAAAVLLVIAGAVLVGVRIGGDDGGGGGEVASVEELVRQAASQPGSRTAELTTTDGVVAATVVVDEEGHAFVRADAMPGTDAEHTYQLWSVDGGTPVSLGLLGPDPTTAMVGVDGHVHQLAVTLEPAGGSAGPTTTPMASGTLSA